MGVDLCYVAHGFCPSLSEDHSGSSLEVLWVLDEPEPAGGLVSGSQVLLVHCEDGGSLPCAATVDWGGGGGGGGGSLQ